MELRSARAIDFLRQAVAERGHSVTSFAEFCLGITPATLHRILSGTRRASPAMAARIAAALQVSVTELFSFPAP